MTKGGGFGSGMKQFRCSVVVVVVVVVCCLSVSVWNNFFLVFGVWMELLCTRVIARVPFHLCLKLSPACTLDEGTKTRNEKYGTNWL